MASPMAWLISYGNRRNLCKATVAPWHSKKRNEQREKVNKEDRQQKTPACQFRNAKEILNSLKNDKKLRLLRGTLPE
jgi:hypothetical protein